MGIATAMKELTQGIASSREDRVKRIGEIKQQANQIRGAGRDLIKNFQAWRKELRTELKGAAVAWQSRESTKNKKQKKED